MFASTRVVNHESCLTQSNIICFGHLFNHYICQSMKTVKTVWPSGLRRWLKAPFRKGVGSNPTAVISFSEWREPGRSVIEFEKHALVCDCFRKILLHPAHLDLIACPQELSPGTGIDVHIIILGFQAGYSSVGRASDCRILQQSDGPWFDSGWPDFHASKIETRFWSRNIHLGNSSWYRQQACMIRY